MGGRLAVLIGIVFLAYSFLGFHLYRVQMMNGERYFAEASGRAFEPPRGNIFLSDKHSTPVLVARNKNFPMVYAVPSVIEDQEELATLAGTILNIPKADIIKKISKEGSTYAVLAKKVSDDLAQKIDEAGIKGIYVDHIASRFYPLGNRAAQVLGFVAPSGKDDGEIGRYGVEKFYESILSGSEKDTGGNITLTIDPTIQTEAERIVRDLVSSFDAKGGTVIVEDPETGKILAMGSTPSFDPNTYGSFPLKNFVNPAVEQVYEPGSVFKVLTMASGLDAGKIRPDTTFNDTGVLKVSGKEIKNWDLKAHGVVTMTNVIEESLNTGAAFAERKMGDELFESYIKRFGFGEKTGIDLPGEVRGDLRRLQPKNPAIAFATASFGQGVAVTPLQLINAVAAIANGGKLMRPYINTALASTVIREVIGAKAAREITDMMVSAVRKAEVAHISGYTVAGKTGTAQVPDLERGGYAEGKVINTYVGFAPASKAKFVILIKLIEPEGAPLAGATVVPAFRELAQFLLNYYNIPPDGIEKTP